MEKKPHRGRLKGVIEWPQYTLEEKKIKVINLDIGRGRKNTYSNELIQAR